MKKNHRMLNSDGEIPVSMHLHMCIGMCWCMLPFDWKIVDDNLAKHPKWKHWQTSLSTSMYSQPIPLIEQPVFSPKWWHLSNILQVPISSFRGETSRVKHYQWVIKI